MAFPIALGLGLVNGLTSLGGLLGADAAKRRAEAARELAINDLAQSTDRDYNNLVNNDRRNLYGATGVGGDAISQLGRSLGSSLAGSGVYNSSATAGALAQGLATEQANLAGLAGSNYANEQGLLNQNRRYIAGLRGNLAQQQFGEANQNYQNAAGGLSSFLGSLGQFNLGQSGANQQKNGLSRSAGGPGSLTPLAPGAGSFNPDAFGTPPISGGAVLSPLKTVYGNTLGKLQRQQYGVYGFNPQGF